MLKGWQRTYQLIKLRFTRSLKGQVALLIASLSFLPNVVVVLGTYLLYPEREELPLILFFGVFAWIPIVGILSAAVGYVSAKILLQPLTVLAKELSHLEAAMSQDDSWILTVRPQDPEEALILRGTVSRLLHQVQLEQDRRAAFTATLMHDLKTPLIAFHHLLTALKTNTNVSRDLQNEIISQLLQEDERILELVKKMVEVHRFEQDEINLHCAQCNLGALAQGLATRLQPIAQDRGILLFHRGQGQAYADRLEIERALYNLVENALRYAKSQVSILVSADELQVQDDGPGLPASLEDLSRPYTAEPFEIAGRRYTARSTGLGLFIARRIMEAHGGKLWVGKTDNTGTTLIMSLNPPETTEVTEEDAGDK